MSAISTIIMGASVAFLIALLASIALHDLRLMTIPNRLNMLLLAGGLASAMVLPEPGLWSAVGGVFAGAGVLGALAAAYVAWRGETGLGMGDVKFVASAGAWVGWAGLPPLVLLASSSALLFIGMRQWVMPSHDMRTRLPFGPFLSASTLTIWVLQATGLAFW